MQARRRALTFRMILFATLLLLPPLASQAAAAEESKDKESSGEAAKATGSEEDFFKQEEQIVSLATKRPVKAGDAPAIVSVIRAEDIREHGYRSVGEALRSVAGFYPLDDFVFLNFGVRGVNAGARGGSRILKVMLDGQPTSFRPTTANFLGPELIPIHAVEKIEVVRGPGSALYGANAFLGVVNVVTKQGKDLKGGLVAGTGEEIEATSRVGGGGEVVAGGAIGNLQAMAAGSYFRYDRSRLELPRTSPIFATQASAGRLKTEDDYAEPANFYSRLSYDAEAAGKLTVHGAFQRLNSVSEFQDLGPLPSVNRDDVASRQVLDNGFVRLLYEVKAFEKLNASASVAYAAGGPDAHDRFDTGQSANYVLRRYGYQSFDLTAEAGYQLIEALHLTIGVDHTVDYHELLTYDSRSRTNHVTSQLQDPRHKTFNNTGVFGQAIITPIESLGITLGVRRDDNSIYGEQWNGRAGLVYRIVEGLSLKLLFGTSFQAPSPELLFGALSQQGDVIGNPELNPQYARSWEASLGYRTEMFGVSVNTFFNQIKDLAKFVRVGPNLRAENVVDVDSYGFEAETFARFGDLKARASVSYQRTLKVDRPARTPTDLFPSREEELFPRWIVSFGPSYKLPGAPLVLSWDNQFIDFRRASESNVFLNQARYKLDSYFLSTLTLATSGLKVGGLDALAMFQVVDLFDEQYVDPGFNGIDYASEGRRYVLTVGIGF